MELDAAVIYKGLLLGLISAFSFGPVFFTIIETSISRGVRHAISIAMGVLASDSLYIGLAFLSFSSLQGNEKMHHMIGMIGGAVLIIFGVYHFFKSPSEKAIEQSASRFSHALFIVKGFLINSLNPFVIIYWLSAVSIVSLDQEYSDTEKMVFFVTAVGTNFICDILKSFVASRLEHLLTHRTISILYKIVGVALLYFGARLLWKTLG